MVNSGLVADLEFKVVYVGSAENSDRDQILQTAIVGPVSVGVNEITLRVSPKLRLPAPS